MAQPAAGEARGDGRRSSRRARRAAAHRRHARARPSGGRSYAIEIPHGLSLLAFHDPNAEVQGAGRVSARRMAAGADRARRLPDHGRRSASFMALVGGHRADRCGGGERDLVDARWLLSAVALAAPMGFIVHRGRLDGDRGRPAALGIYGILRTADAVTPMPGLIVPFLTFTRALRASSASSSRGCSTSRCCGARAATMRARSRRAPHDAHARRSPSRGIVMVALNVVRAARAARTSAAACGTSSRAARGGRRSATLIAHAHRRRSGKRTTSG